MRSTAFTRRSIIKALGAAPVFGPLLPLLESDAEAAPAAPRLIIFFSSPGMTTTYPNSWAPAGADAAFTLRPGTVLEPLEPMKKKLLIVDGVDNLAFRDSPNAGGHPVGMGTILTGHLEANDKSGGTAGWPLGPSMDQAIAARLGGLRTIQLGVNVDRDEILGTRLCYLAARQPLAPQNNPAAAFDSLFKDFRPPTATGAPDPEFERLRALRKSVLDNVRTDLTRLRSRLGMADQQKLEAHLDGVRKIEGRLSAPIEAAAGCASPIKPPTGTFETEAAVPQAGRLQMEIIRSALACNLTRIMSLQWGKAFSSWRYGWLPQPMPAEIHDISHAKPEDTVNAAHMTRAMRWIAEQSLAMMQLLDAVKEGDRTLLDNSIFMWCTEISRSNSHDYRNMPFVLAGSGGGAFQTGRYVRGNGAPTNKLYTSIAHAMGADLETIGDPRYGTGRLPGL